MASYKDYIPEGVEIFYSWQNTFMEQLHIGAADWEIPATAINNLDNLQNDFDTKYKVANPTLRNTRNSVQVVQLRASRAKYETALRSMVQRFIKANPLVTDSSRLALGVTVPDTIRTKRGTPTTMPEVSTLPIKGAGVKIFVSQETGAEGTSRRAKPKDVARIEVAIFVGAEVPVHAEEWPNKSQHGRTAIMMRLDSADSGKMAWIRCRFIGFNNKPGPWSKVKNEIVPL